jgi:hypothetical protein
LNGGQDFDLKTLANLYGLWDVVYRKEVVKLLEQARHWDPSLKGFVKKKV